MAGPRSYIDQTRILAGPLIDVWALCAWFSWRQLWFPETVAGAVGVTVALIGSAFLLRGRLTLTNMRKSKQDGR